MITKTNGGFVVLRKVLLTNQQARALSDCVLGRNENCNICSCCRTKTNAWIVRGGGNETITLEGSKLIQLATHIQNMLPQGM